MPYDVKVFVNIGTSDYLPPSKHQAITWNNSDAEFTVSDKWSLNKPFI